MSDKRAAATGATNVRVTAATGAVIGKAPGRIGATTGPPPVSDCSGDR